MRKAKVITERSLNDELQPEYEIDYKKVKRNPYYKTNRTLIEIDEDVAKVFQSSEQVNFILKAIIKSFPKKIAAM